MQDLVALVRDSLRAAEPVAWATVIELDPQDGAEAADLPPLGAKVVVRADRDPVGSLGDPALDAVVARDLRAALETGRNAIRHYGPGGLLRRTDMTVFVEVFAPPRRMIVFGAVDFTHALVQVAKVLQFHVTVCDARAAFATRTRFPEADDVVVDWPQRYLEKVGGTLGPLDCVCVLTHDQKFDIPALVAALGTKVGYIGAMGSRKTTEARVKRLLDEGISINQIEQIRAPIGIDIGARTPEETAVAICAEIIGLRAGVSTPSLRDGCGPIHPVAP